MTTFDVFNGDADGICALHQWRMVHPADAEKVTGVKRDIELLARIEPSGGDNCVVFDISFDANRASADRLLSSGTSLTWFDHHFAGEIPVHPRLFAHIDTNADTCTSLIVDGAIGGKYREWAIVAAFGDNLHHVGKHLSQDAGLVEERVAALAELGELINYNAYGDAVEDLHIHPAVLFESISPFARPTDFIATSAEFSRLKAGFASDNKLANGLRPFHESAGTATYLLPDAPWARRIIGVMANRLAVSAPDRAHALIAPSAPGCVTVSVRAPKLRPDGADALCRQFPNGGGRKAAAGINRLPASDVDRFVAAFVAHYP